MQSYLDIVRNVLTKGKWKKPVRHQQDGTAVVLDNDTLALPNQVFSHNMSEGFPLLTTKKMPLRTILVELEGFIKGITDKQWYKQRGCNIWNEWCNPTKAKEIFEEHYEKPWREKQDEIKASGMMFFDDPNPRIHFETVRKGIQANEDDLGPIYGYQWRKFNKTYPTQCDDAGDYHWATDQLKTIVDTLHKNPYDRRMVCSAWNPNQIDHMGLPPCHYAWNVTVIDDEIHLFWAQRSCDLMLGVPFNIASYASLLMLLAKESGFKPGNLSGMLVDCHIYANHIEGAKEQLERGPLGLPTLKIKDRNNRFSIFDWEHSDVELSGYVSHPKLVFGGVTV